MGLEGLLGGLQRLGPHRPRGAALPLLLLEGHLVRVRVRARVRVRGRGRGAPPFARRSPGEGQG